MIKKRRINIGFIAGIFFVLFLVSITAKVLIKKHLESRIFTGKVAIVIDDWGYSLNNLPILYKIGCPLTLAVLPNLNYSSKIAKAANEKGFEVILHLPLEPYTEYRSNTIKLEPYTIKSDMPKEKVINIVNQALNSVPYSKGVSNHMGSKATENSSLMRIIFDEIKKKDLYFFDSLATDKSICSKVANQVGLRFVKRSVFLDNENGPDYIRGQINQLANLAIATGETIGVCHDRHRTLTVIKEMVPELKKRGIKLVYVSELL